MSLNIAKSIPRNKKKLKLVNWFNYYSNSAFYSNMFNTYVKKMLKVTDVTTSRHLNYFNNIKLFNKSVKELKISVI